jgi:hypothetical protein
MEFILAVPTGLYILKKVQLLKIMNRNNLDLILKTKRKW